MLLEMDVKTMQKMIDDQLKNNQQALRLVRVSRFIFAADTWKLYQQEADENTFVKVSKTDAYSPKTYKLPPTVASVVLMMLRELRELQVQGEKELSEHYQLIVSKYFN